MKTKLTDKDTSEEIVNYSDIRKDFSYHYRIVYIQNGVTKIERLDTYNEISFEGIKNLAFKMLGKAIKIKSITVSYEL